MPSVTLADVCPTIPATSSEERPRSAAWETKACRASCGVTFGPSESFASATAGFQPRPTSSSPPPKPPSHRDLEPSPTGGGSFLWAVPYEGRLGQECGHDLLGFWYGLQALAHRGRSPGGDPPPW